MLDDELLVELLDVLDDEELELELLELELLELLDELDELLLELDELLDDVDDELLDEDELEDDELLVLDDDVLEELLDGLSVSKAIPKRIYALAGESAGTCATAKRLPAARGVPLPDSSSVFVVSVFVSTTSNAVSAVSSRNVIVLDLDAPPGAALRYAAMAIGYIAVPPK